jgi:hypothetical protein
LFVGHPPIVKMSIKVFDFDNDGQQVGAGFVRKPETSKEFTNQCFELLVCAVRGHGTLRLP